ncbi:MAG TPA: phenylalanine--tRNA ligase subunit beta [Acidobacteriaceae bacterium]|nr:phenylalanine--tRNA ligase subunit beta [Acidobacteriaceae bacterium]
MPPLDASDRTLADDLTLRGIAVEGVFDVIPPVGGSLFETDITTNRVDAMNHYGIAREAAAIYGLTLPPLDTTLPAAKSGAGYPVRIEAPDACGRFTARILRGVTIGPSQGIVAERFAALGQKLILNAVDASNYVLLGMGHPTHAFDLDKIEGAIIVRHAHKGERLKTLDGVDRVLDADDVVVADEKKALGLAGVMGGWDTMITPETKNILVEAAWFDPAVVRRMSRRHGIHSDASHRFERGADFHAPPVASALVSQLILQNGGHIEGEFVDVVIPQVLARVAARRPIAFSVARCAYLLGRTSEGPGITDEVATGVLRALGCTLTASDAPPQQGRYSVTLPSWRLDLEREIDLVEEVARVYGYNRFANTLPAFSGTVLELPRAPKQTAVRNLLLAAGYHEAISSTFCSAADAATFAAQPGVAVAMDNPLSEEAGMLRPSLVPGMLTMLAHNLNRNVDDVRLFEMGTVFSGTPDRVDEEQGLAFGATGQLRDGLHSARVLDFYDLKGLVEAITSRFASRLVYYDAFPPESGLLPRWLNPARAARCVVDGSTVGYFGELDPDESAQRKLRQPVLVGEIYLDRLFRQSLREPAAHELSRYQPVRRDFSLIFPDAVHWETVGSALAGLEIAELQEYRPAEIFRDAKGKAVPAGHYSMLVATTFQSPERTLRDEELHEWSASIVNVLESLGGKLRG